MDDTVVAVAGTAPGGLPRQLLRSRGTRADRRADDRRADDRRGARGAPVAAAGDHRRATGRREHLRPAGAPRRERVTARADGHATRSAVTAPPAAASVRAPGPAPAASGLCAAAGHDAPAGMRGHAVTAPDEPVAAGRAPRQGD
ncbi:protein kilB [Streptomyces sp. NPDC020983]|uniref:protein kilB n=1 Tax=Streptomyces sp. NPDC020983 TaxID=3365106 RepID=UPI00379266AF